MVDTSFAPEDLKLICEALDSHCYWQLSDEHYRNDGHVCEPGSDDVKVAEEIAAASALHRRLLSRLQHSTGVEMS